MAIQYWDDILYPSFRAAIRGTIYGVISRDEFDEECYNVACRAIAAFKFPKISLEYKTFYANWNEKENVLEELPSDDECDCGIPHAYFTNEITYKEVEVIIGWMKVYWIETQISNADNFEEIYTDANIRTYSRANAIDKNIKMLAQFREQAKDLENRYSRVTSEGKPALGEVNEDGQL